MSVFGVFQVRISPRSPVDTERKLNIHKTFKRRKRRPGRLPNILYTFNLRPVFTGLG